MENQNKRVAVLDIGTNTFHILIAEIDQQGKYQSIHKEKVPVKLGAKGINLGYITEDAIERAKKAFEYFNELLELFKVHELKTIATSAVRSAANGQDFKAMAKTDYNIDIEIIDGNREAELIYKGICEAIELDVDKHLIMDIGGGSVEFILCNVNKIFWKQSFEIGGQRLVELFHKSDPILISEQEDLISYLDEKLKPLVEAGSKYHPSILVGASGTFDTLCEIYYQEHQITGEIVKRNSHVLPIQSYQNIHQNLVLKNRDDRMKIPGMIEMRVDMIVVSSILIDYVIKKLGIHKIYTSGYALKEGVISEVSGFISSQ